jgi:hypothetical protein
MPVDKFVKISRAFDEAYPGAVCREGGMYAEIWIDEEVRDDDPRLTERTD